MRRPAVYETRPRRLFWSRCADGGAPPNDKQAKLFAAGAEPCPATLRVACGSNQPWAVRTNDCGGGAKSILRTELARRTGIARSNHPAHPRSVGLFFPLARPFPKKRSVLFPSTTRALLR